MEARHFKLISCLIFAFLLTAGFAYAIIGALNAPDDRIKSDIQGGAIVIVVLGPRTALSNGNYEDLKATQEMIWYNATVPASSYSQDEMTFTWSIETELNTTVYSHGPNLKYRYFEVGNYSINVSVMLPDNSTGWKTIEITITLDYDGDGIADWWEREWFGSTAAVDATTDHDGDGWTDLQEYENQTNPTAYTYKAGFLDEYWWLIILILVILVVIILYLAVLRPRVTAKRKSDEQKKIAAAVEIEKTLLSLDDLEEPKGKK